MATAAATAKNARLPEALEATPWQPPQRSATTAPADAQWEPAVPCPTVRTAPWPSRPPRWASMQQQLSPQSPEQVHRAPPPAD